MTPTPKRVLVRSPRDTWRGYEDDMFVHDFGQDYDDAKLWAYDVEAFERICIERRDYKHRNACRGV